MTTGEGWKSLRREDVVVDLPWQESEAVNFEKNELNHHTKQVFTFT